MDEVAGYRLIELLGVGGSGEVWRAYAPGPCGREVALKQVRPASDTTSVQRLRREADTLSDLDHPHIVTVLDVVEVDAAPPVEPALAIVMALARGGSLRALLDERGRLAPGEVVGLLAPVADAVASAHRRGIVHGDLKPENVLLTSDGEPLVADFGAARHLSTAGHDVQATPEYRDGRLGAGAPADAMADIYAIAVMAHEALIGRRPAAGEPPAALRADASVPPALAQVVDAARSPSLARRPGSAGELCLALRAAVAADRIRLPGPARRSVPSTASPGHTTTRRFGPRPPVPGEAPARRLRPVAAAGTAVAMVGLVAAVVWGARSDVQDGRAPAVARRSSPRQSQACPTPTPLPTVQGEELLTADLAGDGCRTPVGWDGSTARLRTDPAGEALSVTFTDEAGRPLRGQLILGDWDGDGTDAPALYLPDTGEVVSFDRLAGAGEAVRRTARPTGVRSGTARVVAGRDGSETVEVRPSA